MKPKRFLKKELSSFEIGIKIGEACFCVDLNPPSYGWFKCFEICLGYRSFGIRLNMFQKKTLLEDYQDNLKVAQMLTHHSENGIKNWEQHHAV